MKIVAHMLVKNEEYFVWFAINSILDHVDEIIIWDTGSTDKTVKIIKTINNPKISFDEKGEVNPQEFGRLRNDMVKLTNADWIFILDGDEIWSEAGIEEIVGLITRYGNSKDLIVSPVKMLIGDIYHYQEEKAGRYKIKGRVGHFNVRAVRNFEGLKVKGYFGNEGFTDINNIDIQDLPEKRIIFAKNSYFHASHLKRSPKVSSKYKHELGISFPKDCFYPEVFCKKRPEIVSSPWKTLGFRNKVRAFFETPLKKIKRRII